MTFDTIIRNGASTAVLGKRRTGSFLRAKTVAAPTKGELAHAS
ncbi:hypothetical protein [Mycobacterium kyorinense]|nr:hypothetical protein [Mycobacterium kyorinense]